MAYLHDFSSFMQKTSNRKRDLKEALGTHTHTQTQEEKTTRKYMWLKTINTQNAQNKIITWGKRLQ